MNTRTILRTAIGLSVHALLLLIATGTRAQADVITMTSSADGSIGTEQIQHMTATVTAVDQKARLVTLKDEDGAELEFAVGDDVKRLAEVKVGDQLEIGYLEAVSLDLRGATEEEMKEPLKVIEQSDRAAATSAPAGAKLRTIRAVVTVEGLSRWLNAITVRGPRGNYYVLDTQTVKVDWENLRIGQSMVATYTEALVMSIEPAAKK